MASKHFSARAARYVHWTPQPGIIDVGLRGTVKWFSERKGFGFINRADGGDDVFISIATVRRANLTTLPECTSLIFDTERDPKYGGSKVVAVNIRGVLPPR